MKIIKILGIAAGLHALALILLLSSPGCSSSKAAATEASPISSAPAADTAAPSVITMPDSVGIRYSPTRPGTTVASALATQPVADVTPATTYTVRSGDSLSSIAKRNQLTKADLAAANNLRQNTVLRVGQKLVIPSKGAPAAATAPTLAAVPPKAADPAPADKAPADATRHVVKAGETLGGIARKYGVRQGEIAVANNITDPRKIQPGQELIIPAKSASAGVRQAKAPSLKSDAAKAAPPAEEDLDAGLKPPTATDVPVVRIDDSSAPAQPKNP